MKNKNLTELENNDYKNIINKIKQDKQNNCGLIKEIKENNNKKYIEEKDIVLFNIITKEKNSSVITGKNLSIGYLLSNDLIYDFVSSKNFRIYRLKEENNKEKSGEYALINHALFENSRRRIKLDENNLFKIEELIKEYVEEYKKITSYINKFKDELINEEYIPEIYNKKTKLLVDNDILI